jgi:nucleoid-associated protein YgaU
MNFKEIKKKYFKSSEEVISMFLGLVIVVVVVGLIFNYFQRNKGNVNIPGSSDDITISDESVINSSTNYEVIRGDSLWKIAVEKYNNGYAWTEIAKANNLSNPSVLEEGQKLVIPEKVAINGEEFGIIESTTIDSNPSVLVGGEYKVVSGDSLWKIAVNAYGDGYQWLKIWNENKSKLPNANGLEIGMTLVIPKLN